MSAAAALRALLDAVNLPTVPASAVTAVRVLQGTALAQVDVEYLTDDGARNRVRWTLPGALGHDS